MKKIGAIDIGSNGIRYSVAQIDENHVLHPLSKERLAIRLGVDAFENYHFSDSTKKKLIKVFSKLSKEFEEEEVDTVRAIATEAFRCADNGKKISKEIEKESGIKIQIIDGLHEAKLAYAAVASVIDLSGRNALIVDIGGGSLELIAIQDGLFTECQSFNLGTVRLLNIANEGKKIEFVLKEAAKELSKFIKKFVPKENPELIATGGNARRMGKLRKIWFEKESSQKIRLQEMLSLHADMKKMSPKEREKKYELREDRAEVITYAMEILLLVINILNVEKVRLPKVGLINGLFEEILQQDLMIRHEHKVKT